MAFPPDPFEEIGRSGEFSFTDNKFTGERVYDVFDADDEFDAADKATVQLQNDIAGSILFDSPISTVRYQELDRANSYRITFGFKPLEPLDPQQEGDPTRTDFEFSDDGERRYYSFDTTGFGSMLDFGNAIGVNKQAGGRYRVEGAELPRSNFNFGKRVVVPLTSVTDSFVHDLETFVGNVNNAGFAGFDTNEVIFRGASGSQRSPTEFEIYFRFSGRQNVMALNIGGVMVNANGWDIIDPFFLEDDDGSVGIWETFVHTVFVHRVTNQMNFNALPV